MKLSNVDLQTLVQIIGLILLIAGGGMAYQRILSKIDLWGERFTNHRDNVITDLKDLSTRVTIIEQTAERRKPNT